MLIKLSKFFYLLIIIYYGWFQVVFFQIPNMLLLLGAGMISFIFLHALKTNDKIFKHITIELKLWIAFAFFLFVSGVMVATNYGYLFKALTTYIEYLVLIYGIIYISNQDKSIDFFIKVLLLFAFLCAITTLFWGIDVGNGRISMGLEDNPNSLGITMAIGVCCILFQLNIKKLLFSIVSFTAIFFLTYIALLTGSRKSFISIIIMIIFWLFFVMYQDLKKISFNEKIKGIFILLFALVIGCYVLYPYLKDSLLFLRLTKFSQDEGDIVRGKMYREAFDFFMKSPLVGIGFNNFRALSIFRTYSHSTYAEALSCVGIIGSLLYFIPYITIFKQYLKMLSNIKIEISLLKEAKIMLGLFGILLFLGIGIIHFYEIQSNVAFGMLIAFYNINRKDKNNIHNSLSYREI